MNQNDVTFPLPRNPPNTTSTPKKLRRITRACDFCHKRSIRCKPGNEDETSCQNCLDFNVACTYNRPVKKRGIKSGSKGGSGSAQSENGSTARDGESDAMMLLELTNGGHGNGNLNAVDQPFIPEKWRIMVITHETKIKDLVEVYFMVVYPM